MGYALFGIILAMLFILVFRWGMYWRGKYRNKTVQCQELRLECIEAKNKSASHLGNLQESYSKYCDIYNRLEKIRKITRSTRIYTLIDNAPIFELKKRGTWIYSKINVDRMSTIAAVKCITNLHKE